MTVEEQWNLIAAFVEPEHRRVAQAAYFAGYAAALGDQDRFEEARAVRDQLLEIKCG